MTIGTLYDTLAVARDASAADIRAAYRRAARASHPDIQGETSAARMADVNEAWRVLGDPVRRRDYDLSLATHRAVPAAAVGEPLLAEPRHNPLARYQDPPRLPWRFMGMLLLVGLGFVIVGVVTAGDPVPPKVDNVLDPGDCVVIEANGDAAERLCAEPHDGTVQILLTEAGLCPEGSEPHRDRQGMGVACVRVD
ncbi:MAG: DnaJ domain-containing protein [Ilumatobacteraceae bacterium]